MRFNGFVFFGLQGDYIRHPVLYELSHKYGVAGSDQVPLPARLDELREHLRREIRKVRRYFSKKFSKWISCIRKFWFMIVVWLNSWRRMFTAWFNMLKKPFFFLLLWEQ